MKYYISILLTGLILLSSCASKRNYNKAQKYDQAGLYSDAANLYYKSLVANKNNIDAKLGLQRTGQMVLEDKIETFKAQYNNGTAKEAVYAYREAENYFKQLSTLGVKLILAEEQKAYYHEVKDRYLDNLYQQAMKALSLEEFSGAEVQFAEIITFDKSFKDAKTQWITAKFEPVYRKGNKLMTTESYRSAYNEYYTINKYTNGYKSSLELQTQCLNEATLSIAILPFTYHYKSYKNISTPVRNKVTNHISQIKSPFYKLISDESITSIPGWSTAKFPTVVIKNAKQKAAEFEAKSILSANIEKYMKQHGRLIRNEKRGYLKQTVEVINKDTRLPEKKVVYKKIKYYEYKQKNNVALSLNYVLNRIDKNEIALSDTFNGEETDEIHYAHFEGDYKRLIPGYWKFIDKDSEEDRIYDSSDSCNKLHSLFKKKKEIQSTSKLEIIILDKCAQYIASNITNYKPEN